MFLIHVFKNSLSLYTKKKKKKKKKDTEGWAGVPSRILGLSLIRVGLGGESGVLILTLPSVLFPQVCPREEWPQGMNLQ